MTAHQLQKTPNGWHCSLCDRTWQGKPRAECPGVMVYEASSIPANLKRDIELTTLNLKPKGEPVGCIIDDKRWTWLYDSQDTEQLYPYPILERKGELKMPDELRALNRSTKGATPQGIMKFYGLSRWQPLYRLEDCPIADPSLPPVYTWGKRPEHLETPYDLQKFNLKPGKARPEGCIWDERKQNWIFLYNPDAAGLEILDPSLPTCYRKENIPPELKTLEELKLFNLKPKEGSLARGCYRTWEKYSKYEWDLNTIMLYAPEDCENVDPSLPPCYAEADRPLELKTERELKELNLAPGNAVSKGCYQRLWYGKLQTTYLYHPDDCQWQPRDRYITKTTLRQTYLLSGKWIKRLGEPDVVTENPHHYKFSDMCLYSKQRVEAFLANNAEEYARWLDERDRYLVIFELHRERIEAGRADARERARTEEIQRNQARERQRLSDRLPHNYSDALTTEVIREQTSRCLRCASGCATADGFLCVVHPLGLQEHQIPCPDWQERAL